MKFEKKDAYKELVARMTAKGEKLNLSERSINEQIDTLMPLIANEEMELSDFVDKVIPVFNTSNANVRHDVSSGIDAYKKANPNVTETKKKSEEGEKDDELTKRLKALEEKLEAAENEKKTQSVRSQLSAKLKEKGVKDESWIDNLLSEINITSDIDVDAKADAYLALYNKGKVVEDPSKTPPTPTTKKDKDYMEAVMKDVVAIAKSQRLED